MDKIGHKVVYFVGR